jgi:RNA polymerase sigma factor (sigma-70 family)
MNILDGLPEGTLSPAGEDTLARAIGTQRRQVFGGAAEAALNKLVLWTMREAFKYAKAVSRNKLEDGTILSICYEALASSAKQFKPGQQRFLAYAKPNIRGHIARHWQSLKVVKNSVTEAIPAIRQSPCVDWGQEACGFTKKEECPENWEPAMEPDFDALHTKERWDRIAPLVEEVLNEQEKMIITLRYTAGMNFEEAGELLGVSRAAVQRTHARALEKIRCALAAKPALLKD